MDVMGLSPPTMDSRMGYIRIIGAAAGWRQNIDARFLLRYRMQALIRGAMLQCIGIGHPAGSAGPMDAPSGKGGIVYQCSGDCPDGWGPGQIVNRPRML